jgi:hypothetical protein
LRPIEISHHPHILPDTYVDPDLYAGDAADQANEIERLVSLGATRIDWHMYPPDPDFVVG